MFRAVDPKTKPAEIEEKYIEYWRRKKIFQKSVERRKGGEKYVFFDGPPFANGLPHYGHIIANALKDAVTRYFTMRGYYVPRVNGWDCHGLPVEYEVEKKLELGGRKDIEEMGVEKFNKECRASVFTYTGQWEEMLERIARWVDTENGYATLNSSYMESIWWVFSQIWEKDMVYQGHKAMHICPRCVTPLSNFEVSQGYKEVTDLSVTVKFPLKDEENTYFLAWTTTPWTLAGNCGLAVGADIKYVKIKKDGEKYILAKELLEKYFDLDGIEIEETVEGEELRDLKYEPIFPYYKNTDLLHIDKSWRVITGDFVTTEEGTGIVHIAGAYGEDDMIAAKENNLAMIQHVGMDGLFKEEVSDFAGKFVKGQDNNIAGYLEEKNLLFEKENYRHSYPHCWRCDTPLLNYTTEAWFISITEIKNRLLKNNEKIHWQPAHIKHGRFGKWLENARDWNISRNRFWGCPIPIWICEDCGGKYCVDSVKTLKERSGSLPKREGELDLHKPYIDEITMPCTKCKGTMYRIPEVLDCWFESGSMPYAQLHYPFENKAEFEKNFPAQFIAEGLDQTRGWFYTLHVISTILFDEPAFYNVIVNGILLAADGEKLSKRKKNYPDPNVLFSEKGVDTTRMFLFSSTASIGEDVRFSEQHVDDLLKKFTLTLWNTYSFFVTYANIDGFKPGKAKKPQNKLDQWILSELHALIKETSREMENYNLTKATRPIISFVDNLSNWYVRRSRRRFWKSENDEDKQEAYETLHAVLLDLSKVIAPFMPFLADEIYRNLSGKESVHLEDWPESDEQLIDEDLNKEVEIARLIVNLGHSIRGKEKIKVRQPLGKVSVGLPKSVRKKVIMLQKEVILEELNVKDIEIIEDTGEMAELVAIPDAKKLGPKYGKDVQKIIKEAKAGNFEVKEDGCIEIAGFTLEEEEVELAYKGKEGSHIESQNGVVVSLDTEITDELKKEGIMREIVRHLQEMRKEAGYEVSDRITVMIRSKEDEIKESVTEHAETIKSETLANEMVHEDIEWDLEKDFEISKKKVTLAVEKI